MSKLQKLSQTAMMREMLSPVLRFMHLTTDTVDFEVLDGDMAAIFFNTAKHSFLYCLASILVYNSIIFGPVSHGEKITLFKINNLLFHLTVA